MISRRRFLRIVSAGVVAAPLVTEAQVGKAPRVAFLGNGSASISGPLLEAFRSGLRDLGYVEGQNLVIEARFADGKPERIPGLVREMLARAPDVIVRPAPSRYAHSSRRRCRSPS